MPSAGGAQREDHRALLGRHRAAQSYDGHVHHVDRRGSEDERLGRAAARPARRETSGAAAVADPVRVRRLPDSGRRRRPGATRRTDRRRRLSRLVHGGPLPAPVLLRLHLPAVLSLQSSAANASRFDRHV